MERSPIGFFKAFLEVSNNKSQSEIIKNYLYTVVKTATIAESGSVLLHNPDTDKLYLFNEDDFLFKQGFLQEGADWQQTFDPWEGMAGAAFAGGKTEWSNEVETFERYSSETAASPIRAMVCVPIVPRNQKPPFGVVSFHNQSSENRFDAETVELIETTVVALAQLLRHSPKRLALDGGSKVFIVHGHDDLALSQLKNHLLGHNLVPAVLKEGPRTGAELLDQLEEDIGQCTAGFVLMTPDDEGREQGEEPLLPRARQNVVLESGYLIAQFRDSRRVCFLLKGAVEVPSDLQGLLTQEFDSIEKIASKIDEVLEEWKLIPSRPR